MSNFQKKLIIEILIALAVIIALSVGIVIFWKNIGEYSTQIVSLRKQLVSWNKSVQSFVAIRSQYNTKAKEYLNILHNVLPERDALLELRKEFQFLAAGDNLSLNFSFASNLKTLSPLIGSVLFNMNLKGDFEKLIEFVKKMDNFQYLISLDNFTVTRGVEASESVIKGQAFFRQ